jgi:pimeloyl-ACP methyl ester carboxylesterase
MDDSAQPKQTPATGSKIAALLQRRMETANEALARRIKPPGAAENAPFPAKLPFTVDPRHWYDYAVDAAQRSILFWDTLRQRGNGFLDNSAQGFKPVLHFDSEIVADGRTFARPVNYALLRIKPPPGMTIDSTRRPYIIIDPRAGHGPGIGGFKDDSQVGVALRAGHPVYFVIFFRDPEPEQTLLDVCQAETLFVKNVRALHPDAPKPAIVGNCQGGWAAMMLAASDPDETGPIVINGAPMSYWGGAWSEGEGDNPMRYAGGMLGGTWLATLMADLGNGKFDGAHLVQNFERLNPANSLWDKYYHVFDNADTEPPRFLEFERWWGAYYLMNREEIEWITRNLFVGNKLWSGDGKSDQDQSFDLREIKSPIILLASLGDNITPPQQAFNWVLDVYESTEEIKARGQVIVGLLHESVGHLGIFVSGKVARKEHAQIVSVLKSIEGLPPGLYGMVISEGVDETGQAQYEVDFVEHRLEDVAARLNRFERADEKAFEAVVQVSDFVQKSYELFAQPFVRAVSNEHTARQLRALHPLRVQNWALSDLNPWLWWLAPAAQAVKEDRRKAAESNPVRQAEQQGAEMVSASLDYYRATRDAMTEATFFAMYANPFARYLVNRKEVEPAAGKGEIDPRDLKIFRETLASAEEGGYVEALARVAFLLMRKGVPLPLSRLELRQELCAEYQDYLPDVSPHEWRRIRGEQEIITQFEPQRSLETLPLLLQDESDRDRLVTLLAKLLADERVQGTPASEDQVAMLSRIRAVLGRKTVGRRMPVSTGNGQGRPSKTRGLETSR